MDSETNKNQVDVVKLTEQTQKNKIDKKENSDEKEVKERAQIDKKHAAIKYEDEDADLEFPQTYGAPD